MSLPIINDPYGVDLLISPSGDLQVGPHGGLSTITGAYNCAQALAMRMKTTPGDLPLHPDYGSRFNSGVVGGKSDFTALTALASAELARLCKADSRFLGVTNVKVVPLNPSSPTPAESASVTATLQLSAGQSLSVADLLNPSVSEVVDPGYTDVVPSSQTVDPLDYVALDQAEADTLQNINNLQSLIADLTPLPPS
jgi:hypothetical protein